MRWENRKLGDLCFIGRGSSPRPIDNPAYFTEGTIPWIKIADATSSVRYIFETKDYVNDYGASFSRKLQPGSLILAASGTLGFPMFLGIEGCIHDGWLYFDKLDGIDKFFLYYKLISLREYFNGRAYGAAIQNINTGILKEVNLDIPPLPTQRKIAGILSAYDDLIENNLKRIKLLEENAIVMYKRLLTTDRLINGSVGDLATVKSGFAFKSADWADSGYPVIKIKNIGNNDIDLNDCSFVSESVAETASKYKLNAGNLLIAMTGATIGKIGMMPKTETPFYLNQRVGIFSPKVKNAEFFLFCFFNESTAKHSVESLASGAAQPNISGAQIESIKLLYPNPVLVADLGDLMRNQFELIWKLKQQNSKLREARDIVLPKLMSGQIEV